VTFEEELQSRMQRDLHSVLVVDDDAATRYAVARTLRSAGFKTMEAGSGAEALEFAEYVSAAVLDLHLPDLLGLEVSRLIHQRPSTAKLPIVHMSAVYRTDEDQAKSLAAGAGAFLASPIDPAVLVATIERLITEAQLQPSDS
jgi:CheY-like chemotaxis protein